MSNMSDMPDDVRKFIADIEAEQDLRIHELKIQEEIERRYAEGLQDVLTKQIDFGALPPFAMPSRTPMGTAQSVGVAQQGITTTDGANAGAAVPPNYGGLTGGFAPYKPGSVTPTQQVPDPAMLKQIADMRRRQMEEAEEAEKEFASTVYGRLIEKYGGDEEGMWMQFWSGMMDKEDRKTLKDKFLTTERLLLNVMVPLMNQLLERMADLEERFGEGGAGGAEGRS